MRRLRANGSEEIVGQAAGLGCLNIHAQRRRARRRAAPRAWKRPINLALAPSRRGHELVPKGIGSEPHLCYFGLRVRIGWIEQETERSSRRHQFAEQTEPL